MTKCFPGSLKVWKRFDNYQIINTKFLENVSPENVIVIKIIAKISLTVTSPIVINMPTRELPAGETKRLFV